MSSYTLGADDVGSTIVASVSASNAGGRNSAASRSVGPVLPLAPVNTGKPAITGTAQQGATLIASNGTWSNTPSAFTYVWEDCNSSGTTCSPIAEATSNTYTLRALDVGKNVGVTVTASN